MNVFLFVLGFAGIVVSLVLLVVDVIKKKPKKKSLISLGVCFILFVAGVAMTSPSSDIDSVAQPKKEEQGEIVNAGKVEEVEPQIDTKKVEKNEDMQKVEETKKEVEKPIKNAEKETTETLSQKNAVGKANNYLSVMAFSKSSLVKQLEYEGFSNEDATYAVNKIDVDWKEQAVLKAKSYLDIMNYSRSGLIEQLEYEGFSNEEATYAVDKIGF